MNELLKYRMQHDLSKFVNDERPKTYLSREEARRMPFWKYFVYYSVVYKQKRVAEITFEKYINAAKWIREIAPEIKLKDLDFNRSNVQLLVDSFGKNHRKRSTEGFRGLIITSLRTAQDDGFIDHAVITHIDTNSIEKSWSQEHRIKVYEKPKTLDANEYQKLRMYLDLKIQELSLKDPDHLKNIKNCRITTYLLISILAHTGARYAEILGVTIKDIYDDSIKINKTWDYRTHSGGYKPTKNICSMRKVVVDKTVIKQIKEFWEWKKKYFKADPEKPLWYVDDGLMYNSTLNFRFRDILHKLGIKKNLTVHKLRHTYISYMLSQGISEMAVAKQAGHANVNMIHRVYGHLLDDRGEYEKIRMAALLQ